MEDVRHIALNVPERIDPHIENMSSMLEVAIQDGGIL